METLAEMIARQELEGIEALINWCGSQTALARLLNESPQVVAGWVRRGRISATAAAEAEKQTRGAFKKSELRPDVKNWRV